MNPARPRHLVLALSLALAFAAPLAAAETAAERDTRMAWFREARFGMFIHWGLYAKPAGYWDGQPVKDIGEWIQERGKIPNSAYSTLVPQFNPVKFDARAWVGIAKAAGMKYIVITSKHHDGFALWRSQVAPAWSIAATPFPRDPLKELADECARQGLTLCFYHSIMDWHHPDYAPRREWNDLAKSHGEPDLDRYIADKLRPQLRELLTRYGRIGILWFDGEWEKTWTHAHGEMLDDYVRALQPGIIVNNRVDKGRNGMKGMSKEGSFRGDYGTPEQEVPPTGFGAGVDWESCMTMNKTWGFKRDDQDWKTATTLVHTLVDCASKGGNFLLNVGPTAEGEIPAPSVERLAEVGRWMKANAEAIRGTTPSPFKKLAWGRATQKPGKIFLHVFDWPADGKLAVPLATKIKRATLLAAPKTKLNFTANAAGVTLALPAKPSSPHATVIVLEIDGAAQAVE